MFLTSSLGDFVDINGSQRYRELGKKKIGWRENEKFKLRQKFVSHQVLVESRLSPSRGDNVPGNCLDIKTTWGLKASFP